MKRRFTILSAALALLVSLAIPMGMWGQTRSEVNYVFSDHYSSNTVLDETPIAFDGVITATFNKRSGGTATQYYTNGTSVRWYGGGTLAIVASNATMSSITLTFGSGDGSNAITTNVGSYENGAWTGSASSVTFTQAGTSGNRRISAITVTYTTGGTLPTTFTVTFDAGDGNFVGNQAFPNTTNTKEAGTYTLPSAEKSGYTFDGWLSSGSTEPLNGEYTVENDVDFTAHYTESNATIETLTVGTNGNCTWSNGVKTAQATVGAVTFDALGTGGNDGKYYSSDNTWRFYTANTSGLKVSVPEGNKITSVAITWKTGQPITPTGFTASGTTSPTTYTANSSTSVNEVSFFRNTANVLFQVLAVTYEPLPAPAVAKPTFDPESGEEFGNDGLDVTISCATTGSVIYYTLDESEPTAANTQYQNAIHLTQTTTIKAIAYVGTNASTVATATYTYVDPDAPGSVNNPYTVAQARAAIDAGTGTQGVHVAGIVSNVDYFSQSNHYITYFISADGSTESDQLEAFHGKGINGADFTSADDIQEGDIVVIYGNLTKYNSTYELAEGNYLVSLERPNPTPIINAENVSIAYDAISGEIAYTITNPVDGQNLTATTTADWISNITVTSDKVTFATTANDGNTDRTATITLSYNGASDKEVTVTQGHYVAPVTGDKYVKVTSTTDLTSGQYLIVYEEGSVAFDGSLTTLDAASNTIGVVISNNEIAVNATTAASEFAIDVTAGTIKSASGFYIGQTSDANGMKTSTTEAYENAISIGEDGADIVSGGAYLRYNANSGQERFRYFKSSTYTGQKAIQLYKKVAEPITKKTIIGYNTEAANGTLCWYLIASPVGDVAPANVTNMLSNSYDLFYFDHAMENEWVNYKPGEGSTHPDFGIEKGKGYLYANSETVELEFPGSAYTTTDGRETVRLAYTNTGDGYVVDLPGWNLVGNPFAVKAYLEGNRGFYTMDMDGNFAPVTNASIESMEGIFVVANPEVEEDAVTFTTTEPAPSGKLSLNLSNGRKAVDRAIVRFDGGNQLPKLQLFGERTKLYIPVEGQDYAIVSGEEMGEMPVSFKAENNGSYTLSVNVEEVSFAYLHLIDNMTGNDVDLLQTPSYSFEAKTTDYASRFKLVFATGDNSNDDNFAFYSNGSFVINNEGNAELQVIDIMGRIVKSESINGCANVSVNGAAGVYMLRLVNGDNVKVQKVVVK